MFLGALGQAAGDAGRRLAWLSLETLGVLSVVTGPTTRITKAIARILRADLVLTDDIGLLAVSADAASPAHAPLG